jgi:hypothetical protein
MTQHGAAVGAAGGCLPAMLLLAVLVLPLLVDLMLPVLLVVIWQLCRLLLHQLLTSAGVGPCLLLLILLMWVSRHILVRWCNIHTSTLNVQNLHDNLLQDCL